LALRVRYTTATTLHALRPSDTTGAQHFDIRKVHDQLPSIRSKVLHPRTIQPCDASDRSAETSSNHHPPENGSSASHIYYGHQTVHSHPMSFVNYASPQAIQSGSSRRPIQDRVDSPITGGRQSRRLAHQISEQKRRQYGYGNSTRIVRLMDLDRSINKSWISEEPYRVQLRPIRQLSSCAKRWHT
jgi:hypothetical protein